MDHSGAAHAQQARAPQLLGRLDKMVEAGRIAEGDAARLRAAAESGGFDGAVLEIRLKHAKARVGLAVEQGRMTQAEANAILQRLDNGEDPLLVLRRRRRPVHG